MKDKNINWVNFILSQLSKLENNKGIELLNNCGKECSKTSKLLDGAINIRKEFENEEDLDIVFEAFKTKYYNTSRLTKKGNSLSLTFDECTCTLVEEGICNSFLCYCTVGFTKKIFETLFNKTITVELKRSILKGDDQCEQIIYINT